MNRRRMRRRIRRRAPPPTRPLFTQQPLARSGHAMSLCMRFEFPHKKYFATSWAHHPNEGVAEWPPAPWRVLRALISAGFKVAPEGWADAEGRPSPLALGLLHKLSAEPPEYRLPLGTRVHTRHYTPIPGEEKTKLLLSPFVQLGEEPWVDVRWERVSLSSEEERLLVALLPGVGYLGRSESVVEASVVGEPPGGWEPNCFPYNEERDARRAPMGERFEVMGALPAEERADWLREVREAGARPPKGLRWPTGELEAEFLFQCLTLSTDTLRAKPIWARPPLSAQLPYLHLPSEVVGRGETRRAVEVRGGEYVLLGLQTATGRRGALPGVARTRSVAECLHQALACHVDAWCRADEVRYGGEVGLAARHQSLQEGLLG
ncbi:MAG: type I-U CRISPR-associated protein Cas5/Cas6, partial [Deltaproteobacteria bacterium]|nr:type I-U CRISPR-associated protein Cas5/Cas6 [Deltaproteobacteria bacterium]